MISSLGTLCTKCFPSRVREQTIRLVGALPCSERNPPFYQIGLLFFLCNPLSFLPCLASKVYSFPIMFAQTLAVLFTASAALAGPIQIRQAGYNVTAHANSATAGLLAPGYSTTYRYLSEHHSSRLTAGFFWPEARGYNRSSHRQFCGGFPTGERTDFPISECFECLGRRNC